MLRFVLALGLMVAAKWRRRTTAFLVFAALAGGALAQTRGQTTVGGVFDPDTADLNAGAAQKLKHAADKLKNGNQSGDGKCFPPARTNFKTYSKMTADPSFYDALATTRADALKAAMTQAGLNADEFAVEKAPGNDGDVAVSADTADRNPPILKVTSSPTKGKKVKTGDKIEVTINASERYEDGHKSRPSGVQRIELSSNTGGLVDSRQFGNPPDPCARQTVAITYTVVNHPPPIVHLHAAAFDAAGHQSSEDGDFPTGDWSGIFEWSLEQDTPAGHQHWDGHADISLDDDGKGGLTGNLSGAQNQKLTLAQCHATAKGPLSAELNGTFTESARRMTINIASQHSNWPSRTPCAEGISAHTGSVVFAWPQIAETFRALQPIGDDVYETERTFTVPVQVAPYTIHYKLKLTRAK